MRPSGSRATRVVAPASERRNKAARGGGSLLAGSAGQGADRRRRRGTGASRPAERRSRPATSRHRTTAASIVPPPSDSTCRSSAAAPCPAADPLLPPQLRPCADPPATSSPLLVQKKTRGTSPGDAKIDARSPPRRCRQASWAAGTCRPASARGGETGAASRPRSRRRWPRRWQ